jgi:hypothetical protein
LFGTLWQVDAAIAAIALPLLLFVIELSKDDKQAVTRSHEVLIRSTSLVFILTLSAAGLLKVGIDALWFPNSLIFVGCSPFGE